MAEEKGSAFELGTDGPKIILVGIDDSVTSLRGGPRTRPGGPVVGVWDGLDTHTSRAMRELIAARAWPW